MRHSKATGERSVHQQTKDDRQASMLPRTRLIVGNVHVCLTVGLLPVLLLVVVQLRVSFTEFHYANDCMQDIPDAFRDKSTFCIASGDENDINKALNGREAEAVLCQRAVFNLSNAIIFSHNDQKLYTSGRPTGDERATLRVTDNSVVEAIVMANFSNAVLSSVIVDGNRPELGFVSPASTRFGGSLIVAGGAASGQVISNVKAYEPRGAACLHLHEGASSITCNGAIVTSNSFGPSGLEEGPFANGISLACKNSTVAYNKITDVTGAGISIFGAFGSVVAENTIVATTRKSFAGIEIVDFDPNNGNFAATYVRNNVIDAKETLMHAGIAMGQHFWFCDDSQGYRPGLFVAVVSGNILHGKSMRHGYVLDGVRGWNMAGNVDTAQHKGISLCRKGSEGLFQKEFTETMFNDSESESLSEDRWNHPGWESPFEKDFTETMPDESIIASLSEDWWIHRDWQSPNRSKRFPGIEERVKVYMSNWYYPPCQNVSNPDRLTYSVGNITIGAHSWPQVTVHDHSLPYGNNSANISSFLQNNRVLLLDQSMIRKCSEGLPELRPSMRHYCNDSVEIIRLRDVVGGHFASSSTASEVPLLAYFGDVDIDTAMRDILYQGRVSIPVISKFRELATGTQLGKVTGVLSGTDYECINGPRDGLKTKNQKQFLAPIIWKLNTKRHWYDVEEAKRDDVIPWKLKKAAAVWRGDLTGKIQDHLTNNGKKCRMNLRCNFVLRHANSRLIDAKLTDMFDEIDAYVFNRVNLVSPRLSFKQLQTFKAIISLPGNDVASGLKWQLLSTSVVVMPPPKRTSWLMEELLEPWVHYVPLNADGSNAEKMVQWVLENDDRALQIAEQATLYMEDMLYHPDAEQDEFEIKKEIMRRYKALWTSNPHH